MDDPETTSHKRRGRTHIPGKTRSRGRDEIHACKGVPSPLSETRCKPSKAAAARGAPARGARLLPRVQTRSRAIYPAPREGASVPPLKPIFLPSVPSRQPWLHTKFMLSDASRSQAAPLAPCTQSQPRPGPRDWAPYCCPCALTAQTVGVWDVPLEAGFLTSLGRRATA